MSGNNKKFLALLDIVIVLLILVIINFTIYNNYFRVDLTKNKLYTISNGTKGLLNNLDEKVNVNVYFSKDLPVQMNKVERDVKDMLDEFVSASNGKIVLRYINPEADKETEKKVRMLGIPKIQMNVFNNDKAEIKNGYIGIAILYENKHEVLPVVQDISNFEYDMTMAIKKVQQKQKDKIAYFNLEGSPKMKDAPPMYYGQQQPQKQGPVDLLKKALKENYKVVTYSANSKDLIDNRVKGLIIVSPSRLSNRDMFVINQYALNGGNIIVFDNSIMRRGIQARDKGSNINKLLTNYGLSIDKDVVADLYSENAAFNNGGYQVYTKYPFFISVLPQRLNRDLPITSKLETITLPWVSSIKISKKDSVETKVVAYSSNRANKLRGYYNLTPQQKLPFITDSIPLVALSSGKFKSIFNKYVPYDSTDASNITPLTFSKKKGSILVVGSADMVTNEFLQRFRGNIPFILNAVDYMCQDNALIDIRSKQITPAPLKEISPASKQIIRAVNILLIPLLMILFGIIYNKRRIKGTSL